MDLAHGEKKFLDAVKMLLDPNYCHQYLPAFFLLHQRHIHNSTLFCLLVVKKATQGNVCRSCTLDVFARGQCLLAGAFRSKMDAAVQRVGEMLMAALK